jgi:hypothetical protein
MKKLQEFDEKDLGNNPFSASLVIPVTEVIQSKEFKNNGEGVVIKDTYYSERQQKVTLYYCYDCGNNVFGLSDKAQRLLWFIVYTLKPSKDFFQFNQEYYMKSNNVKSLTTINGAIKELIRYDFIVNSHIKTVYWINVNRLFPGARLEKYGDKKVIKTSWDKTKL